MGVGVGGWGEGEGKGGRGRKGTLLKTCLTDGGGRGEDLKELSLSKHVLTGGEGGA